MDKYCTGHLTVHQKRKTEGLIQNHIDPLHLPLPKIAHQLHYSKVNHKEAVLTIVPTRDIAKNRIVFQQLIKK